jgi:hypothetical protein
VGVNNSSDTRVSPVFSRLLEADPSGAGWLPGLLQLGSRASEIPAPIGPYGLVPGYLPTWGRTELSLPAPLALLQYLVRNVSLDRVATSGDTALVRDKRTALARGDPSTRSEALGALSKGRRGRHWYVLEGQSRPDATLVLVNTVVVIEGKRTERSCTCKTKWMGVRSQLIRHMDAATDYFPDKQVLGLLIVEGDGGAEAVAPSAYWEAQSQAQYTPKMLIDSLPHRSTPERNKIKDGILGVATWQAVCEQNSLPWPPAKARA